MKLPIAIAEKLLQMLAGSTIPASQLKHAVVTKMVEDGVIAFTQISKTKRVYYIVNKENLFHNLRTDFGINDLYLYIERYRFETLMRADAVEISGNSKLRSIRTFKGFLINSYHDIEATLNGLPFIIHPQAGSYTFVYDFAALTIPENITIVGIENPENFQYIRKQKALFAHIEPLFVSRYPQSNDLVKWLQQIPNRYLHFGDLDFEGINIFLYEYKKWLGDKASFFIPENIAYDIQTFGNRNLYDKQLINEPVFSEHGSDEIAALIALFHQYKKVLEQEWLINRV